MTTTTYTVKEVSLHNKDGDVWIVVGGNVYNVSAFAESHPGGLDALLTYAGGDCSDVLAGHSQGARQLLKSFWIGTIANSVVSAETGDDDSDKKINLRQPVLKQLWHQRDPEFDYHRWLESTSALSIPLFAHPMLEALTKFPWWVIYVWVPVMLEFLIMAACCYSYISICHAFVSGLFTWTALEYCMHRYVFHAKTNHYVTNMAHFLLHGIHHLTPHDSTRITFPLLFSIPIGSLVYLLMCSWVPNTVAVDAMFSGFVMGYLCYDTLHYLFHHRGSLLDRWEYTRWLKIRHQRHHFENKDVLFGVSSPLFDILFRTDS